MSSEPISEGRRVYDPRGRVDAEPRAPAARPRDLRGLRLAVLDNTKWNAGMLLGRIAEQLESELGLAGVRYFRKESFSKSADPSLLEEIAASGDLALTAIGD